MLLNDSLSNRIMLLISQCSQKQALHQDDSETSNHGIIILAIWYSFILPVGGLNWLYNPTKAFWITPIVSHNIVYRQNHMKSQMQSQFRHPIRSTTQVLIEMLYMSPVMLGFHFQKLWYPFFLHIVFGV